MNSGLQSNNPNDRSYRAEAGSVNLHNGEGLRVRQERTTLSIPQLVGAVYCAAPPDVRARMLEHLMRPLGVLSLAAVARGAFAKIRFRSGWPDLKIRADDLVAVKMADVTSLVEHVQQVDERVVVGLAELLQAWPRLCEHDAASTLSRLLCQRSRRNSLGDTDGVEPVWH